MKAEEMNKREEEAPRVEVLEHLLPAVVYASDHDPRSHGLTSEEVVQLAAFCLKQGEHWAPKYDAEFPEDMVQGMAKCDVTGRIGWCIEIEKA